MSKRVKIMTKIITKVVTNKVRLNYVNIFKPRSLYEGDGEKYSLQILIPKSDEEFIRRINSAIELAKIAGAGYWECVVPENLKTPLRDGDLENLGEEYAGHYYMNLSSKDKPIAVDRHLREIKDQSEVYSGCYANVSFNLCIYRHEEAIPNGQEINLGISCRLLNLQKVEEGYLIGRSRPEDDFVALEEAEENF